MLLGGGTPAYVGDPDCSVTAGATMGEITPVDAKACEAPANTLGPKVEWTSDLAPEVSTPANNCRGGGTAPYTFEEEILSHKKGLGK